MKEEFKAYLKNRGNSKSYTDKTIYNYANSVENVRIFEGNTWEELAENITAIIGRYDRGGEDEDFGDYGRRTVINALKRFQEFVRDTKK